MTYRIGELDPRFGVPDAELRDILDDAMALWQAESGRTLFKADRSGSLAIHLQYDKRQDRWEARQQAEQALEHARQRYEVLREEHDTLRQALETRQAAYRQQIQRYELRLAAHNTRVRQWNRGEIAHNAARARQLDQEAQALERQRQALEEQAAAAERSRLRVNQSVEAIRVAVEDLNRQVAYLNERFAAEPGYDKARYTRRQRGGVVTHSITVYQFHDRDDLRQVLAHELGHALGISHVEDPGALMYYRITDQNRGLTRLTAADHRALRDACGVALGGPPSAGTIASAAGPNRE
ncbi:peptidase M10A and M12B matrixin and adamalysin [Thioalkalivibrio nitratireducens DSM 14787]|uniref:Peptidase M10A and M12B matrixin and adamalysin n=1 Tax=Thioalkalivibrio nitratireducens (strain DSM 14787 / UNIQEM 213 / ALEN2) TaxID=1255043 RepID=L0DV64_THIND|nr:peptidase M10A and M12B matrixin and adamalysin [Thioalkalivibrio nitratireducens DSM 14787]